MIKLLFGIRRVATAALVVAVSVLATGCALDDADVPSLTGPSEFGLSVTATATPDLLVRDGVSQSVVTLIVRDAQNRPVAGQRLTLGVSPGSARLSVGEVVTDANGQATFTVTAPPATALAGDSVIVFATPVGNQSGGSVPRTIEIFLTGVSNTSTPSPSFTVTPASPEVGQVASFDASATTDEGVPCLDSCSYVWTFGNEAVKTGRIQTHAFQGAGVHSVSLTVRDAAGTSASTQQSVIVTAAARPTVSAVTVSPTTPFAGQSTSFTAVSTAAPNHRIVSFAWQWGDGTSSTTTNASTTHTFDRNGIYVVTVTATDDLGQSASASTSVTVGGGASASFTFSPTNPQPGDTVQFNGSPSSAAGGATITEYKWDFGDGSTETESEPTTSHSYGQARTYVVRLTVTDSAGRTGTTTQNVVVAVPEDD
jgi:PKD repeat protein